MSLKDLFKGNENNSKNLDNSSIQQHSSEIKSSKTSAKPIGNFKSFPSKQMDSLVYIPILEDKKEESRSSKQDNSSSTSFWNKNFKRTEYKCLYLFLIEDSSQMYKYNYELSLLLNMVPKNELVCCIHYGDSLHNTGVVLNDNELVKNSFYCVNEKLNKMCFYDAIFEAYNVIEKNTKKEIEGEICNYKIDKIEITGIGKSKDNCSKISIKEAKKDFQRIINRFDVLVNSRYICLNEEDVVDASEFGFRTITIMCEKNF